MGIWYPRTGKAGYGPFESDFPVSLRFVAEYRNSPCYDALEVANPTLRSGEVVDDESCRQAYRPLA